jgi:hypothetical protein
LPSICLLQVRPNAYFTEVQFTIPPRAELALDLVNQMNKSYKVVRFVLVDGWVWANVEMYIDPLSAFRGTFDRCADLLCEITAEFRRRMR